LEPFSYFFDLAAGCVSGAAGLAPFVHVNFLIGLLGSAGDPLSASVFIVSLGCSQFVFSLLPAVFFGLPSPSHSVSALPAQGLALEGRGFLALNTMLYSSVLAFAAALLLAPAVLLVFPVVFDSVRDLAGVLLAALVIGFFASEKSMRAFLLGLTVFFLSGALGFVVLSFSFVREPLLPLLSGLFGIPLLIVSFNAGGKLPGQRFEPPSLSFKSIASGVVLGAVSAFVPAASPAVLSAAVFSSSAFSSIEFLSVSSAISASKLVFDLATVFSIDKARSGMAAAVQSSIGSSQLNWLVLVAAAASFFAAVSFVSWTSPAAVRLYSRFSGRGVSSLVLFLACAGLLLVSGPYGLAICIVAAFIGLLPPLLGIRHAYAMGALFVPTLAYYSGLSPWLMSLLSGA